MPAALPVTITLTDNRSAIPRTRARLAYQQFFPHYPLAAGSGNVPIQQAFTVGRVRFIITDLRYVSPSPVPRPARRTPMSTG